MSMLVHRVGRSLSRARGFKIQDLTPRLRALPSVLLCAFAATGSPQPAAPEDTVPAILERLEGAWQTRDVEAWLALWDFASPDERQVEREAVQLPFASEETVLTFLSRPRPPEGATRFAADLQLFVANEPRARVAYWRLEIEKRAGRWVVVSREDQGQIDGLVHVSMSTEAFRARDVSLRLEDFELLMEDGTLFRTPRELGPTAFVFVGRARVRFSPRPLAEREQVRQFSGRPTIDRRVKWAFFRLHPADYHRALQTDRLQPEPDPGARRDAAARIFRERVERSFLVDAPLPRSPWWLMPVPGDAVVDFPWGRRNVLTLVISSGDPEDVSLFDRDRETQICEYPSGGREPHYSEDDDRVADVLEHDILARFDPDRAEVAAAHTMRLRLLRPASTLRLRLHDDFRIATVQAEGGRNLLFFRVRGQDSLVVSLGPLAHKPEPFSITIRYGGRHDPAPVDQELLQVPAPRNLDLGPEVFLDKPPLVYANRTAWYPRPANEDFATARVGIDTPEDRLGVTGGELVSTRTESGRTRTEYRLDQPGKFITVVVGRLGDVGLRQEGEQAVRGYSTPRTRREALDGMRIVQQLMTFYAGLYGPSPYPSLGLAVAEAETPGGHSPPGLIYLQSRPLVLGRRAVRDDPANFGDIAGFFLAHEAAHQWWGQATAPASYRERWLSEAWAQYSAALWVRERYGEDTFRDMMDRMARWAFKHDALGPIHLGQRLGHLKRDPQVFRSVVYDKGAWVLHMLRGLVGDEAFFRGTRTFLDRFRYAKAGSEDLRAALEEASGRDLRPYFERWVYGTGLPVIQWTARTETSAGGYRTTVSARPQGLPGPMPLHVTADSRAGRLTRTVLLEPAGGSWTIDTEEEPKISLNEDRGLLARVKRVRRLPAPPQR